MRRRKLTDAQIAKLPRKSRRYTVSDPEQRCLYLRVPPVGPIVFTAIVKANRQQKWVAIASSDEINIDTAREKTREIIKRIRAGKPAIEVKPPVQSVASVTQSWLTRVVDQERHRTAKERRRIVERLIIPAIGNLDFVELRRSDITALLDRIQDNHGSQSADHVLSTLRAVANWMQSRDDSYRAPFVRGMKRTPISQHRRARILNDVELAAVWRASEAGVGRVLRPRG